MDDDAYTVSLREYVETRIASMERLNDHMHAEMERSIELARAAMDKRLDTMNEFRESLKDQASHLLPRTEYDAQQKAMVESVQELRESRAELRGKASMAAVYIGYLFAAAALLLSVLALLER